MAVRPIRASDYEAVNALHRAVGWPERSFAGWRWLEDNPARLALGAPAGWVVADDDDRPVALLGNFVQRFQLGERTLFGATGFSIIVPPDQKGASRSLIRAFLAQPGLFARYTLNANARSAPLYGLFGLTPFPPRTHALKLSWPVDRAVLAQARLLRRLFGRLSAERAARLGERLMNRRLFAARPLRLPDDVEEVRDLSDASDYAVFWTALRGEDRLLADRSPALLRWRMADPDQTLAPRLLACRRDGRIVATALALVAKTNLIDAPALDIIDLVAMRGHEDALPRLARTLIANARGLGAAKVRLQVATPELLDALDDVAATARREGGWGHGHAIVDEALAPLWSPTPFDGDYAICARPVPLPARRRTPARAPVGRLSKA